MKYVELLTKAEKHLIKNVSLSNVDIFNTFSYGAFWMSQRLQELDSSKKVCFNASTPYNLYGFAKYGISFTAFLVSLILLVQWNIFLAPLSIIIFYIFEIQFLFLFPILIDNIEKPIWKSIRATFKLGFVKALTTVVPIGLYMMMGLLNLKNPLRNWYIGCMAILIWYQNEIRDRI